MYVLLFLFSQIRFILLQNRQGKTRLAKYYVPLEDSEKHKVEYEVRTVLFSLRSLPNSFFVLFFLFLSCNLVILQVFLAQVHRLVVNRDPKFTNFVEVNCFNFTNY